MKINIGGLQKFSLSDYPNKIAAIIFLRGCNFRCSYCHNKNLWNVALKSMPLDSVFDFLKSRKNQLDGVVITGGEPTIYADLPIFLQKIKNIGYHIKLNTNGSYPHRLKILIQKNLLDYIAMDIKAPFGKYNAVCMRKIDIQKIQQSISLITESHLLHEFRTTYHLDLFPKKDLNIIKNYIPHNSQYFITPAQ